MKTNCMKCRNDTENIDPKMFRTKNNRLIMQPECSVLELKSQDLQKNNNQKVY